MNILEQEINRQLQIAKNREETETLNNQLTELRNASDQTLNVESLGLFSRGKWGIDPNFFFGRKNITHLFSMIDSPISEEFFSEIYPEREKWEDVERGYMFIHTCEESTTDYQIISSFNPKLLYLQEIMITAGYIVNEDMHKRGPLYELSLKGQQNLDLGYCMLGYKDNRHMYDIYLERLKIVEDTKHEYHLHASQVPRIYKPMRHRLSR